MRRAGSQKTAASVYEVAPREIVAVEHPMIIQNLDKSLKTFGTNRPFRRILDSDDPEECLPLYLRQDDPMCVPILSHNTPTTNVLLQVTVPKRTGKKRKKGSDGPFTESGVIQDHLDNGIRSYARKDHPLRLIRTLRDNVDKYHVTAAGEISQTHRFRGLADFHQSTSHTEFLPKFEELVRPGKVEDIRKYKFDPRVGWKSNEEILPPPLFTHHALPFNWVWLQNPNITNEVDPSTGQKKMFNRSRPVKVKLSYLPHNAQIPTGHPTPIPDDPAFRSLISDLETALNERPIWTRRALVNRIGGSPYLYLLKQCLQFVSYQFKGGPWRDGIIKLGVDPRTDPKYRIYQTMFFKIYEDDEKFPGMPWHDVRYGYTLTKRSTHEDQRTTHIFDGKSITLDGKVWQMCDIKDPLLMRLINSSPCRPVCQTSSDGWYTNGTLAKIKSIMKTKLIAIRTNKTVGDEEFAIALEQPDIVYPSDKKSRNVYIPVPDLRLTEEELTEMKKEGIVNAATLSGIQKREGGDKKRRERIRTMGISNGELLSNDPLKKRKPYRRQASILPESIIGPDGVERPGRNANRKTSTTAVLSSVSKTRKERPTQSVVDSSAARGPVLGSIAEVSDIVDPQLLAEYEEYKRSLAEDISESAPESGDELNAEVEGESDSESERSGGSSSDEDEG